MFRDPVEKTGNATQFYIVQNYDAGLSFFFFVILADLGKKHFIF